MDPAARDWDAQRYLRFDDERTRAARDLLAAVPRTEARQVVDLGCGPGNSTELLIQRFPGAAVLGLDSSPDMLEKARARVASATFEAADVASWRPSEPTDVVFANALFQWIPDHLEVMSAMLAALSPGGVLAVQMPDNLEQPSHRAMREVAALPAFAAALTSAAAARATVPPLEQYYDRLRAVAARVDVWRTVYHHVLDGPAAIVAWFETTGLRPFLDPLSAAQRAAFVAAYQERIATAYPSRVDGKVLLRFPRVFMVCVR